MTVLGALTACLLVVASCQPEEKEDPKVDFMKMPTFTESGKLNAIIEIPAGTNHTVQYNEDSMEFQNAQVKQKDHVVNFLPYLGNLGFIPGTYMDPDEGGDGRPLDILVLSESVPTKTVMEVIPIGTIQLRDMGVVDNKIVAVPVDPALRTIQATELGDLRPELIYIIELWFLNYQGAGHVKLFGWKNEKKTYKEIEKWQKLFEEKQLVEETP